MVLDKISVSCELFSFLIINHSSHKRLVKMINRISRRKRKFQFSVVWVGRSTLGSSHFS